MTHTFWVFWPILTYLRKGLLRPGLTILSYPKLIVMEETIAALMLATPRILVMGTHMHETGAHKETTHSARTQQ